MPLYNVIYAQYVREVKLLIVEAESENEIHDLDPGEADMHGEWVLDRGCEPAPEPLPTVQLRTPAPLPSDTVYRIVDRGDGFKQLLRSDLDDTVGEVVRSHVSSEEDQEKLIAALREALAEEAI